MEVGGGVEGVEDAVIHIVAVTCVALIQSLFALGLLI